MRQTWTVPPTTLDRCDWCYGSLTESDLTSKIGMVLGEVEAAACSRCVAVKAMLRPPDSLYPNNVQVAGDKAWMFAVLAAITGEGQDLSAVQALLREVAGYD
jgi:hypothetical protein